MGNPLRDRRTPSELAASGQVIEFSEKISSFDRLMAIIGDDLAALDADRMPPDWRDRAVTGRLSFGFADAQAGCPALEGEVCATIDAVCQRCLEPLRVPLAAELRLLFADQQSVAVEDDGYEVWELDEDRLRPPDLVEEALIMALPYSTMHVGDARCREPGAVSEGTGEKTRPFAALKAQMERDNGTE